MEDLAHFPTFPVLLGELTIEVADSLACKRIVVPPLTNVVQEMLLQGLVRLTHLRASGRLLSGSAHKVQRPLAVWGGRPRPPSATLNTSLTSNQVLSLLMLS